MGLFDKKSKPEYKFSSRAEAFNYMLTYLIEEKNLEPLEASKQANEFAEIFSNNMGIPSKIEPEPEGIDKMIVNIDKIVSYADKHPKVLDFLAGALTLGVGFLTGKASEQMNINNNNTNQPQTSIGNNNKPIDWDNEVRD